MFTVREEIPGDIASIRDVSRMAFGGDEEVHLVDGLHYDDNVLVSLVAVSEDNVVGYILFSPLVIESPDCN